MLFNVQVQVEAEDSFGVLDILKPLKDIEGVKVGSISNAQPQRLTSPPTTQISGSRIGGQPGVQIEKLPTTTQKVAVP